MSAFGKILSDTAAKWLSGNRTHAREALAKLKADQPLDFLQLQAIKRILELTLAGYDPRTELGIAPKPGKPPTMTGYYEFIAAHYLSLKKLYPLEKNAASEVAEIWAITKGRVRTIARENMENASVLLAHMSDEEIAKSSSFCAEVHRRPDLLLIPQR